MPKLTTLPIVGGQASSTKLNANYDLIEAAMEKTLSRDGTGPNQMTAVLDMNSQHILNLPWPIGDANPATKKYVDDADEALYAYIDSLVDEIPELAAAQAAFYANQATVQAGIAEGHASSIVGQVAEAEAWADAAGVYASAALTHSTSASTSATGASNSAGAASTSAANASTSATQASNSASTATGAAASASTSQTAAATSAFNAGASETAAAGYAGDASTDAGIAAAQATIATTQASAAATSASNAATSSSAAGSSASSALTHATNASTSATNAANSATAADGSADAAFASEGAASTYATQASTSETNAAGSASSASTSAGAAATSATNAGTSASAAATSETNASTYATAAGSSASASSTSALVAKAYAIGTGSTTRQFDFQQEDTMWTNSANGSPDSVSDPTSDTYTALTGVGKVHERGGAYNLFTKYVFQPITGHTYRISARVRRTVDIVSGSAVISVGAYRLDSSYAGIGNATGTAATTVTVASGWVTITGEFTDTNLQAGSAAYIRPRIETNGDASSIVQVQAMWIEDITDVDAIDARVTTTEATIVTHSSTIAANTSAISSLSTTVSSHTSSIGTSDALIADLRQSLAPSTFEQDGLFFTSDASTLDPAIFTGGTFTDVASIGRVAQTTGVTHIMQRGLTTIVAGKTYRITAKARITSNATNGYAPTPLVGAWLWSDTAYLGAGYWVSTFATKAVSDGWFTITGTFTLADLQVATPTVVRLRVGIVPCWNGSGTSDAVAQTSLVLLEDVTDITATNAAVTTANANISTLSTTTTGLTSALATTNSTVSANYSATNNRFAANQKNSQNMLRNSTFRNTDYWNADGSPTLFGQAYTDHTYVYMAGEGSTNYRAIYQDVRVEVGARYSLSGDIYSDNSNTARLFARWLTEDRTASVGGNSGYDGIWSNPAHPGWTRVTFDINNANSNSGYGLVAPSGAAWLRVYADNYPGSASSGGAAFRRIKLERGDYCTAWSEDDGYLEALGVASDLVTTDATVSSHTSSIATNTSAISSLSSTVSANYASLGQRVGNAINPSPNFADNTNATGLPTNWVDWSWGGTDGTRVTGLAPQPYAYQQAGRAGDAGGIAQQLLGKITAGWHVIEADITLVSGALTGAGAYTDWDGGGAGVSFATEPDITGSVVGAGTTGRLYKFRKLVQITLGSTYQNLYAMSHWGGFGSTASANSITWHRCAIRPASQAEIEARQATTDIGTINTTLTTTNATVSGHTSSIATNTSAISSLSSTVSANYNTLRKGARNLHPNPSGKGDGATAYGSGLWTGVGGGGGTGAAGLHQARHDWLGGNHYHDSWGSYSGATDRYYYWDIPLTAGTYQYYTLSWQGWVATLTGVYVQLSLYDASNTLITSTAHEDLHTLTDNIRKSVTTVSSGGTVSYARIWVVIPVQSHAGYCGISMSQIKLEIGQSPTAFSDDTSVNNLNVGLATSNANIATNATAIATEASARAATDTTLTASISKIPVASFDDATQWTLQNATISTGSYLASGSSSYGVAYGKGYIPLVPGNTYTVTARHRVTADGTNNYHYIGIYAYNASGTLLGQYWNGFATTAAEGWTTDVSTITAASIIAAYPTAARIAPAMLMNYNNVAGGAAGATCECSMLELKDATATTTLTASVSTNASAIATINGAAAFYEVVASASGGTPARIGLKNGAGGAEAWIDASNIFLGDNTVFEDPYNSFYTEASSKRFRFGGPFPSSGDMVMWFGPTSVTLNSETRTNGYFAFGTDGQVYYGAGALSTATAYYGTHDGPAVASRTGAGYVTSGNVTITPVNGTAPFYYRYTMLENPNSISLNATNGVGNNTFSVNATISAAAIWRCNVACDITDAIGRTTRVIVSDNELYDDT